MKAHCSPLPQNKEIYRRGNQWCNVSPFFYAKIMQYLARRWSSQPAQRVYWPFCWLTCIYLAGVMAGSMRNAICVATQTSKVPTRVALLYISLFCASTLNSKKFIALMSIPKICKLAMLTHFRYILDSFLLQSFQLRNMRGQYKIMLDRPLI